MSSFFIQSIHVKLLKLFLNVAKITSMFFYSTVNIRAKINSVHVCKQSYSFGNQNKFETFQLKDLYLLFVFNLYF